MPHRTAQAHRLLIALVAIVAAVGVSAQRPQAVYAAPISEAEPNDSPAAAQSLPAIGADSPVLAQANDAGDVDWYRFAGVAGRTYVVELFSVARAFEGRGNGCTTFVVGSLGIGLSILDPNQSSIATECDALGSGNTHRYLQFKAGIDGDYYVGVLPANPNALGNYSLRVLPKHDEPGATWNPSTYEPNNTAATAYGIQIGSANAITSDSEERNSSFATNGVDQDWYRFEAVEGRTYGVELFNVARAFDVSGNGCTTFVGGSRGIGLEIYDDAGTQILIDCTPSGAGNAHHYVQFKAGLSGTFYIHVAPGGDAVTGAYSLRVLPQFDDPAAAWNTTTYEPNNVAIAAYVIKTGYANALTSSIEERNSSYSTNRTDQDWYRFAGVAGETYTVEVYDVKLTNDVNGNGCTTFVVGSRGIGLEVFDPTVSPLLSQCNPQGSGNVHHRRQFTAGLDGTFYIHVSPGGDSVSGTYSLRVLTPNDAFRALLPLIRR